MASALQTTSFARIAPEARVTGGLRHTDNAVAPTAPSQH
ncbi:hypothetical protein PC116_g7754 [Phytophthora cactorum]|nr:hypothetical protein PC116_g7754 [Phytophthora cactorum]